MEVTKDLSSESGYKFYVAKATKISYRAKAIKVPYSDDNYDLIAEATQIL